MVHSIPPSGDFGPSKQTLALRPELALTPDQVASARRLRRKGQAIQDIAAEYGVSVEDAKLALAGLRTQATSRKRATVNIGNVAYRALLAEKSGPGEPLWQTMDRILTELQNLRGKNS